MTSSNPTWEAATAVSSAWSPVDPTFDDWCVLAYPANLVGLPATVVPAGLSGCGLPIGLQLIGPRFSDRRLLGIAASWETIASWQDRHPAVYAG